MTGYHLRGLKNLQSLYLSGTEITDDGLKHLSDLTDLQVLSLSNTRITDDGLNHLRGLKNLHYLSLSLRTTRVTHDGVKMLEDAVPDCYVDLLSFKFTSNSPSTGY